MNGLSTVEFVLQLRSLNVTLSAAGDRLCCSAPTGVITPNLHNELAARKAEILRLLKEAALATRPQPPTITPISRDADLPLSFGQLRLWLIDRLEPGVATYNIPSGFRSKGKFSLAAFEQSLTEIVRRHEVLRTYYLSVNGRPVQEIAPPEPFKISVVDLQALPESERQKEAARLESVEAARPFDLDQAPLMRATLLKLAPEEQVLLMNVYHIAFDGWSFAVFAHELSVLYKAFLNGQASPLPELPIQYVDFAAWQRQWFQGEVLQTQLDYWKERLSGSLPVLELPTDRPRAAVQTYNGGNVSFAFSKRLTDALKSLSQREGVTLFVTLLAAFNVLLLRYTGQEDLLVGTPIANRNRLEIEGLIGFFVNTLVMRTDLKGNPTFQELLRRVLETALGAYAHQDLPYEKLVEELNPERASSRSPIFQVMFSFRNTPVRPLELPGLNLSRLEYHDVGAKFDLALTSEETDQGLAGWFNYNADLLDHATVVRMAGHFETLLEGIASNPKQRLHELPLLTDREREQLLVEWNDTATDFPRDKCIHELFEEQVERTPNQVAVVFNDQRLSYRKLNQRANQLAHYLRRRGVGPEVLVGICMERSIEWVVGLLGVLKAGGAYVPLDPAYPKERLALMLKDAQVPVLLTQERWVAGLAEHDAEVICLDSGWQTIASESGENPSSSILRENVAYVIFTSGSTGQPKGVLVSHGSIVDHCRSVEMYYELDCRDVVLQSASLSFDVSLEEILPTLIVGAQLVIMEMNAWHPAEFHRKISEFGLTVLYFRPAYWQELAREWAGVPELIPNIQPRLFIVGGDTMSADVLKFWERTSMNSVRLLNAYGPTETTITATVFEAAPRPGEHTTYQRVPIGRPLANRAIYILDQHGNPVPIGVHGQLHIGGVGLARGYLNRPDLTAERFIPDPFSGVPGTRIYKTGDMARYRPDGNIELLGRADHQVKIRGFRIELGEIEAVLGQHPAVREAAVVVREEGEKRLVAYLVLAGESACTSAELRDYLKQKLPDYMVPAAWVVLSALPLTPNGKVDRKALPAPATARLAPPPVFVAPRTPIEELVSVIWCDVLRLDRISIQDNFFELGGHSLSAAQLFAKIHKTFNTHFPLAALFEAPTVEKLSAIILDDGWSPSTNCLVPIRSQGSRPPLFLVHAANGEAQAFARLARHLGSDQPVYALQESTVAGLAPLNTVEEMATHYLQEMRSVQPQGPYHLGGYCFGGIVAFEMARRLAAEGHRVDLLALLDSYPPCLICWWSPLQRSIIRFVGSWYSTVARIRHHVDALRHRGWRSKLGYVEERLKVVYGRRKAPPQNPMLLRSVKLAMASFKPQAYPGAAVLFKVKHEYEEGFYRYLTDLWRRLVKGNFTVRLVPGRHETVLEEPNVATLAYELRTAMGEIFASSSSLSRTQPQPDALPRSAGPLPVIVSNLAPKAAQSK